MHILYDICLLHVNIICSLIWTLPKLQNHEPPHSDEYQLAVVLIFLYDIYNVILYLNYTCTFKTKHFLEILTCT